MFCASVGFITTALGSLRALTRTSVIAFRCCRGCSLARSVRQGMRPGNVHKAGEVLPGAVTGNDEVLQLNDFTRPQARSIDKDEAIGAS